MILSMLTQLLTFRFRKRISLELELVALRHQIGVLQRTKRHPAMITTADRLIWTVVSIPQVGGLHHRYERHA